MKRNKLVQFLMCCKLSLLVTFSHAQLSGSFTIANPGGDYTSFTSAVADLVSQGISGPVTFDVAPGIYNEQITIPEIIGASATSTITFQGLETDSTAVLLSFTPSFTNNYVVRLDGADFITFRKMHIQAVSVISFPFSNVIYLRDTANNVQFLFNKLELTGTPGRNVIFQFGNPFSFTGDNLNISFNEILNGNVGIGLNNAFSQPSATGVVIKGNRISGQEVIGINFGNYKGIKILKNIIIENDAFGIWDGATNHDASSSRNLIADNTIFNSDTAKSSCILIESSGLINNLNIYHNTLSGGNGPVLRIISNLGPINIVNNILVSKGTGSAYLLSGNSIGIQRSDHNCYFAPNAGSLGVINWFGVSIFDISTLQTTNGKDVGSISVDPVFAPTPDLHLSLGSPAVLASGASLIGIVPDDIDSDPRDPISPTIGADEFVAVCPPFTANAGSDATICEGGTYALSGTIGGSASSSEWTTSGSGSFDDPTLLTAVYTHSPADALAGSVNLMLTTDDSDGLGPCVPAVDTMVLTIVPPATADAGVDSNVCAGSSYLLSGSIGGSASTAAWSTSGDGSFDDVTLLAAMYTAGAGDIAAGTVTLTLTTDPAGPCPIVNDAMILTIDPSPTVDAGPDRTVIMGFPPGLNADCADLTANITGGLGPFSYLWSTGETTPTITVCPPGTTVFTVTLTGSNGCLGTDEVKVEVIDASDLPPCPAPPANKIEICHVATCTTTCVNEFGLCANCLITHLSHGDYLGPCTGSGPCPPASTCKTGSDGPIEGSSLDSEETTGIEPVHEYVLDKAILAFPNPNAGIFTLMIVGEEIRSKPVSIYLYDALGQLVYGEKNVNRFAIYIDISERPKGIYFINIIGGNTMYSHKIIYK